MCRDGVYAGLFPEVPQADGIIVASSGNVVAIGAEIHGQHTLEVSIQQHETPPRAEVPQPATGVQPTAEREVQVCSRERQSVP